MLETSAMNYSLCIPVVLSTFCLYISDHGSDRFLNRWYCTIRPQASHSKVKRDSCDDDVILTTYLQKPSPILTLPMQKE